MLPSEFYDDVWVTKQTGMFLTGGEKVWYTCFDTIPLLEEKDREEYRIDVERQYADTVHDIDTGFLSVGVSEKTVIADYRSEVDMLSFLRTGNNITAGGKC